MTDGRTDGRTNRRNEGRTDGRTDTPFYRDARTYLKTSRKRNVGRKALIAWRNLWRRKKAVLRLGNRCLVSEKAIVPFSILIPPFLLSLASFVPSSFHRSTMGQNQVIVRHQKFNFPQAREWAKWASAVEGASEASSPEQAKEWAVRANERTDERVAEYFSLFSWLYWPTMQTMDISYKLRSNEYVFTVALSIKVLNRKI